MRLIVRLIGSLILCVLLVSVSSSYYQVQHEKAALRSELAKRGEVLADSLQENVERLSRKHAYAEMHKLAQRFGNKENLLGIAIYGKGEKPLAQTASLTGRLAVTPETLKIALRNDAGRGDFFRLQETPVHMYALPLHDENGVVGALIVVHDATYISAAKARAWKDMSLRVMVQIALIVLTTVIMFQRSVLKPIARTAAWMRELRNGRGLGGSGLADFDVLKPLANEAHSFARSLAQARAAAEQEARLRETAESSWTAERLAVSLRTKLKGSRLFVISNREPYMHTRQGKELQALVPASGLVTALEPILHACDGTWIAHGSGDADCEVVDARNRVRVPPEDPRYTLRRVWLSKEEEERYYFGFSNEGLWPLCHIAHTRPTFRAADWEEYQRVNEKFADTALDEMEEVPQPIVIVQDYHFALLPKLIKQRRPEARVGIFWHIPWPNPEAFGICPWQRELLDGLLGADLIGFHIQAHCDNFLKTVDQVLESRIEWDTRNVNRADHLTLVRPFPISVVFPDPMDEDKKRMHQHQSAVLNEMGLEALYLGVGVDRIDYTKGIVERLLGVERFLEKYPQYQGKFSFVQIGAPSRTKIKRYADFVREVEETAERINTRFRNGRWQPIVFRKRHHSHTEVNRFYRAADVCLVTSLHDGMNLVAKEYLASRDDAEGMLVLSPFTGAARELPDALIVNPYDTEKLADAIFRSLEMHPQERKARMTRMRSIVQQNNVYRWAGNLITELCELRVDATLGRAAPAPPVLMTAPKRVESEVVCEELVYEFNDAAPRRQIGDDGGDVSDLR